MSFPANFDHPESYQRYMGRWSALLSAPFLEFARLNDGDYILDAGTGTGSLASTIHERLPGCKLLGIDISESFIQAAKQNLPYRDFIFQVGDICALNFATGSFDSCCSLLTLNFVEKQKTAATELRRVTKQGGMVAAAIWDYSGGMGMLEAIRKSLVAIEPESESLFHGPKFSLGREGALTLLWKQAGISRVEEKPLEIALSFADFSDFWLPILGGSTPISAFVRDLPESKRKRLQEDLITRLAGRTDAAFQIRARAWAVRGEA